MGYIRNKTLVVSSWSQTHVLAAHQEARRIFGGYEFIGGRLDYLVSPVVSHVANGGAAFFIPPDGSKEGWDTSDQCDKAISELIEALKQIDYLDWALILLGGDDYEFQILQSPATPGDPNSE